VYVPCEVNLALTTGKVKNSQIDEAVHGLDDSTEAKLEDSATLESP
jgi:hypothetical protein